ncbi:MAG: DUF86 domain-containing protein [bacterium]
MLDAALEATSFVEGQTREAFDEDRQLALSLVKLIEIIGEAATKVGAATRADAPEIPWADITGMRHRLIHAYYEIDFDLVWHTVVDNLPPLISALERMLPSPEE